MKVEEAINKRTSVRKFSNKKVKFDLVLEAIDAANQAPFAGNINNLKFIIIEKDENKNYISEFTQQYWINDSEWVVIVCSELKNLEALYQDYAEKYARQQAGAAIENLLLTLTANKLGACWIGSFSEHEIKSKFRIPESWSVEAIIPIGYPKLKAEKKKRKIDLENKIFWEQWNETNKKQKYPHKDPSTSE